MTKGSQTNGKQGKATNMKAERLTVSRRVFNKRNSSCNVPLDWLDQWAWWTDSSFDLFYLHVQGNPASDPDGRYDLATRVFRVYPRIPKGYHRPGLALIKGELWWKFSKAAGEGKAEG